MTDLFNAPRCELNFDRFLAAWLPVSTSNRSLVYFILSFVLGLSLENAHAKPAKDHHEQHKPEQHKPEQKKSEALDPILKKVNLRFHQVLKAEFEHEKATLGPALFFENNILKLIRNGQVVAEAKAAPTVKYHQVKAYSHMCMAAAIKLLSISNDKERAQWAKTFSVEVEEAQKLSSKLDLSDEVKARQLALSSLTYALLDSVQTPNFSADLVFKFIKQVRPLIIKNFEFSAADHITQLDLAVKQVFEHLLPGEKEKLHAFTYGPRGPRSGNLIVQYLAHLLGQNSFIESERVIYGEGLNNQESAVNLVSKHNLELALGQLLFEDSLKLQKDVLSDAAYQILSEREAQKTTKSPSERLLKDRFMSPRLPAKNESP